MSAKTRPSTTAAPNNVRLANEWAAAERSELRRAGLDDIDQRLLDLLREDARMSNVDLARAVDLSPSSTLARVKSLRDRGVIRRFTTELNPRALGYTLQALVSVRIRPGARHLMEQISSELRELPEVHQLFFLGGAEDFLVHVRVRDSEHVRQFVLKNLSANPAVALTETNLVFEHHQAG
ncbi:MAG TPA: Lrp/AsnC family transcriptional regulator [Microbacteriaceae bacterium]|nr:Lrp/AsnC family transcriptional regulator [Microbacteriaceae bacterium]